MKARAFKSLTRALCGATLIAAAATPAMAEDAVETFNKGADLIIGRPAGVGATAVGAAVWIGTLPLTFAAGVSPEKSMETLVIDPFRNTFQRPLGADTY